LLSVIISLALPADISPEAVQLERDIISGRQKLVSGIVEIESNLVISAGEKKNRRSRWRVYFDGPQLRCDELPLNETETGSIESVTRVADEVRVFRPKPLPSDAKLITGIYSKDSATGKLYPIIDPRLIGLHTVTYRNLIHYTLDGFIGSRIGVTGVKVEAGEHQGAPCKVLLYEKEFGTARVWVRTELNNGVVAIVKDYESKRQELDCELQKVPGYGWFPSVAHVREFRGDKVFTEENLKVVAHDFNRPIDSAVFTLRGMGAPEGETVYDFTNESVKIMRLTASGLVPADPSRDAKYEPIQASKENSSSATRWLLIVNGLVFAVLALLFVWRRRRSGWVS